jgi:MFS family permease
MNMAKPTVFSRASSRATALGLASVLGFTTLTAFAPDARADDVSPTGKGIAGGALLGGEVVTITESLAGVHAGWAYLTFGGLGMVAGGVGGWAVEQASGSDGQGPVYMLAGGMALIIPALVLSLNATRYRPSENATEDHPPADTPTAEPGTSKGNILGPAAPATPPPPGAPTSLLDVRVTGQSGDGLRLGVPVPNVRAMYTQKEQAELGLPHGTELRFPVVAVTF